jgi:hypothetical protein
MTTLKLTWITSLFQQVIVNLIWISTLHCYRDTLYTGCITKKRNTFHIPHCMHDPWKRKIMAEGRFPLERFTATEFSAVVISKGNGHRGRLQPYWTSSDNVKPCGSLTQWCNMESGESPQSCTLCPENLFLDYAVIMRNLIEAYLVSFESWDS